MKKLTAILLSLFLILLSCPLTAPVEALSAGDEVKGNTVCQALGMDGAAYMNWLVSHEHDNYYLGTPYRPYDHRNPNGDCKGSNGWLDEPGVPGMNCMGFVWHVLYMATAKSGGKLSKVGAMADGRLSFYQGYNISRKYFRNKQEMLKSGYLDKGDIIWMIPDQNEYLPTVYHHVGVYWGDGHSDVLWHSNTVTGGQGEKNVISKIYPMLDRDTLYVVLKVGAVTLPDPTLRSAVNVENGIRIKWDAVKGAKKYRVFIKKGSGWKAVGNTAGTSFTYSKAADGQVCTFTVRCITATGDGYTSMFDQRGITRRRCPAPRIFAENQATAVKLRWNKIKSAASYRLYVKDGDGYSWVADTKDTSYIYRGVKGGKNYTFTVRSVPRDGSPGAYHNAGWRVNFVAPPVVSDIDVGDNGIRLTWKQPVGASQRYRIFRLEDDAWVKITDISAASYTDKTALESGVYTYAVRCLSLDGKRYLSSYIKAIAIRI